ncbi:hypothetical protein [Actinophytocola oryzae]|uniref:Uncharacterized protein n=1 Tax=Actinophytocola oryzae TaxID=502181 RepID=A0A4R7VXQ4_9PSEU|nr:hypothetical protein [Actinophytocola oryzae]TDV54936.1 hypothetical protein CLV71_103177 [Actinophytocola oryzae]
MPDEDVRALFHRIDDGPPVGIDVREVMAAGHRTRIRRTALAFAGSTLAVGLAVVVGVVAGGARPPAVIHPGIPPATTTTSPTVLDLPAPTGDSPLSGDDAPRPDDQSPSGADPESTGDGAPVPGGDSAPNVGGNPAPSVGGGAPRSAP